MTSIHQPNNDIVNLFDQLYVLTSKGQCIYNDHPSRLKQYLVECQVQLMDYQVPIEELIKIASTHSNNVLNKKFDDSDRSFKDSRLLNHLPKEIKLFNFTDLIILLQRTIKNDLIGGWNIQLTALICYAISLLLMLYLFPNNIGTDPGCTQERVDITNISLINQRILDSLIGNEQMFQQNIKFIFIVMLIIYFFNVLLMAYMFLAEIQVTILL